MTGRERVMAVLRGELPDRVPFSPNIGQWFDFHRHNGTLPEELQNCKDELDAMLALGCDIFSRRLGNFVKTVCHEHETVTESLGDGWTKTTIRTTVGSVSKLEKFERESWTTYTYEHFIKDFENDFPVLQFVIEHSEWAFDEKAFLEVDKRVGDNGVVIVPFFQSPIKLLHNWAGQEAATFLMLDFPKECYRLFEVFTAKVAEVAKQAAKSPAQVFCTMDNLDSLFHSPPLFRQFALPFYQKLSEIFHAEGKWLFSHACGRLWALRELISEAGLDGCEGIPHPPIGDLPLHEAKRIHKGFITVGGMTAHETEISGDNARDRIFAYVQNLFAQMQPLDRFIFSSG
ncbi:MAG: uroporphyrinogen decarboxylase family protein [Candidatus Bathyarchaeia archaeon]